MEHYKIKYCYYDGMKKIFELAQKVEILLFEEDQELFNHILVVGEEVHHNSIFISIASLFFTLGLHITPL